MWEGNATTIKWAVGVVLLTLIARFLRKLYFYRSLVHGLPGPPHNWLWGHLPIMASLIPTQPRRIAPQSLFTFVREKYNLGKVFYMDTWPFGPPIMVVSDPAISDQFTVKQSLPKHPLTEDFTEPLGGRMNLVTYYGQQWKTWRSAFNPGFSFAHLMTMVPGIVDDVSVFCEILEQKARTNELFRLEKHATRLTIDIILKVVLDLRVDSQRGENELVSAFESQVRWLPRGAMFNPLELINIFRPIVLRWNKRRMDTYLTKELEKRFATRGSRGKTKHVIDLALETYWKENKSAKEQTGMTNPLLDRTFKRAALDNIEIFIFAGHDTSSSVICYALYHLSRNQDVLDAVRKEHDEVFGTDVAITADAIKENPHLISKLDWTLAVIKEALRLHPPASTVRIGNKDFFVTDPETNERYTTDHFMLFPGNINLHYNADLWGDPKVFRPQRWLTHAPPPEGAHREAFVGFSKGNRNCIGQELALIEIRIVLAMTVRRFDFKAAYDELDKLRNDNSGYPSDTTGVQTQFGEQAYQIQIGTAKPREGMPCRVSLRNTQ